MDRDLLLQLHRELFSIRSLLQLHDTLSLSTTLLPTPASTGGLVASLSVLEETDHIVSSSGAPAIALLRGAPFEDVIQLLLSKTPSPKDVCEHLSTFPHPDNFGACLPLACGIAMSKKISDQGNVTLCFLNARETYSGLFHESLLTAARHNLGIVFVVFSSTQEVYDEDISIRALGYPIARTTAAGSDLFAVRSAAHSAVLRAREKEGPSLVELKLPHLLPTSTLSVTDSTDPLQLFAEKLDALGLQQQRLAIEDDVATAQSVALEIAKRRLKSEITQERLHATS